MTRSFLISLIGTGLLALLSSTSMAFTPEPSESELESKTHFNDPRPRLCWCAWSHIDPLVLGHEVGGARVTMTDVATGRLLASGSQQGEPGDQTRSCARPISWTSRTAAGRPLRSAPRLN